MHTKKIQALFLIVCFSCLFLCSCGLDEYYVIEPPSALREPGVDTADQNEMFYQFSVPAVSISASSQIAMKGTAVFYALYNDSSKLISDLSRIRTANKEYSENGYNAMKSSTTTYQMMNFTTGNSSSEYLNTTASAESYKIEMNAFTVLPGDTMINLRTTRGSDSSIFQTGITKPDSGDWYMCAFAVSVGDVSLQTHYSALAPLGVIRFHVE